MYILDIRYRQTADFTLLNYGITENSELLSLTPYSSYLINKIDKKYFTLDDIIPTNTFNDIVLNETLQLEKCFIDYQAYSFLFSDLAAIKSYEVYLENLFLFLDKKKFSNYNIIYITDAEKGKVSSIFDNEKSFIYSYDKFDKCIQVSYKNNKFYFINKLKWGIYRLLYKKSIASKIYNRYFNFFKTKSIMSYDNENYKDIYQSLSNAEVKHEIDLQHMMQFIKYFKSVLINQQQIKLISDIYNEIFRNFYNIGLHNYKESSIRILPFTYLSGNLNYIRNMLYEKNAIPRIFMQHGSYTIESFFLKYGEIYHADINFVFNQHVKKMFEDRGAKKVYIVGSVNNNMKIKNKKQKYDFVYITYCGSYMYTGEATIGSTANLSPDGNTMYKRHTQIIELFGNVFKNKTICIKIQPNIFAGQMLYIPLLELSKKYKNVHIEFTVQIPKLIEKSKYILSDYFSSDFTNRDLHYKKNIFVFNNSEQYFPPEILSDMKKMFILIDSIDDLKEKIINIVNITSNRKRYKDIIEYYSSCECNTKQITKKMLQEILFGR